MITENKEKRYTYFIVEFLKLSGLQVFVKIDVVVEKETNELRLVVD